MAHDISITSRKNRRHVMTSRKNRHHVDMTSAFGESKSALGNCGESSQIVRLEIVGSQKLCFRIRGGLVGTIPEAPWSRPPVCQVADPCLTALTPTLARNPSAKAPPLTSKNASEKPFCHQKRCHSSPLECSLFDGAKGKRDFSSNFKGQSSGSLTGVLEPGSPSLNSVSFRFRESSFSSKGHVIREEASDSPVFSQPRVVIAAIF
ncbi:hypothetical protein AMTR_s00088p00099280 [Amborella trichopoda]|uniref:Uncharacterized protein n=1 Tax=Amborella trichopoda TaxID=13333 RepID=W1NRE2_AMBTC|nr:hypothetical protein AMTR_s00088p00099280 [Amborella trichopoda]